MDPKYFVTKIKKDILSCSICSRIFKNPKMLDCGHAFCTDCIETFFKISQEGNAAKCPICRHQFVFCKSGSIYLRQSLILRQLLDLFAEGSMDNSLSLHDFCNSTYHCEGKGIPTHYCPRCDKRMCNDCTNAHTHFVPDHDVSPINFTPNSHLIDENNCKCERHEGETLYIHCTTCNSLLCIQCKKGHDKSHSFTTVEEMKSKLKEIRIKILNQKEKLERQQTENRPMKTMFDTSARKAKDTMDKRYTVLKSTLETRKQQLETDFQSHSFEFRKTSDSITRDTETRLTKAASVIHLIDQLFSLGSERFLLESWKIIQEHLNVISNPESKENGIVEKFGIEFRPKEGLQIGTILKAKVHEGQFGISEEEGKLNEASSNVLESDSASGECVYENITSPQSSDSSNGFDPGYTMLQLPQKNEDRESVSFDSDSKFDSETDLSSRDNEYDNIRGNTILESVYLCSTKVVISGAVFIPNNKLFAVSFKSDKIYVFDSLKWNKLTTKETVKPFDVVGFPESDLKDITLVTCHRGIRQKCRIEKYRDGKFDSLFTDNVTYPCGISFLDQTKRICVCESNPAKNISKLKIFGLDGSCTNEIHHPIFKCPTYVGVTSENELLVSDIDARCVWKLRGYDIGDNIVVFGESSEVEPKMSMWANHRLYITGRKRTAIRVFDSCGKKIKEHQIKRDQDLVNPSLLVNSKESLYCISDNGDIFKIFMPECLYANEV